VGLAECFFNGGTGNGMKETLFTCVRSIQQQVDPDMALGFAII